MRNPIFPDFAPKTMNTIIRRLLLIGLSVICADIATFAQPARTSRSPQTSRPRALSESFYFLMNDYKMEHQGEVNTLNIKVSYEYNAGIKDQEYPDFIPIRNDVDKFLREYPNETTFWEIVNKQLTALILKKYTALASVTCEIQVTPSPKYSFTRGSVVTRRGNKSVKPTPAGQSLRREK